MELFYVAATFAAIMFPWVMWAIAVVEHRRYKRAERHEMWDKVLLAERERRGIN